MRSPRGPARRRLRREPGGLGAPRRADRETHRARPKNHFKCRTRPPRDLSRNGGRFRRRWRSINIARARNESTEGSGQREALNAKQGHQRLKARKKGGRVPSMRDGRRMVAVARHAPRRLGCDGNHPFRPKEPTPQRRAGTRSDDSEPQRESPCSSPTRSAGTAAARNAGRAHRRKRSSRRGDHKNRRVTITGRTRRRCLAERAPSRTTAKSIGPALARAPRGDDRTRADQKAFGEDEARRPPIW